MASRDPRVDAHIADAAPFARPILRYLRDIVHQTCPEVEETLKWRMPTFMHHGILAGMGAFKEKVMFGFWKGALITGEQGQVGGSGMGEMRDITTIADLPPKRVLVDQLKQAMRLNEEGIKNHRAKSAKKPAPRMPTDFKAAISSNKKADQVFKKFSPSHRREYVEWITEAKTSDTRKRRLYQALEWIAEGKPRNWKYMKR